MFTLGILCRKVRLEAVMKSYKSSGNFILQDIILQITCCARSSGACPVRRDLGLAHRGRHRMLHSCTIAHGQMFRHGPVRPRDRGPRPSSGGRNAGSRRQMLRALVRLPSISSPTVVAGAKLGLGRGAHRLPLVFVRHGLLK